MMAQPERNFRLPFILVFIFVMQILVSFPGKAAASRAEYENLMQGIINHMYQEMANKIDGLDPIPSDFTPELTTLENYARDYVKLYQPNIPVKNRLHALPDLHALKRKERLDAVNSIIKDVTDVHAKYGDLFKKLQSKRDKLIILHAGKLVFDYVLLPLDRWNFIADRIVNYYNDKAGPVKFVPEGGLGATSATRRLGEISKELDDAHTELKELLYTVPKNSGDYFRIVREAELMAKKCWDLSYKIQYGLRKDRNNSLAIAERKIMDELDRLILETDRILGISSDIAMCRIDPGHAVLDRTTPTLQVTVYYRYQSDLETPAKTGDFEFEIDHPDIASVDKAGNLTGLKTGETQLSAVNRKTLLRCSIPVTVEFPPVTGKTVPVPDLTGMTYQQAQAEIQRVGLNLTVNMAAIPDILFLPDTVIRQSPRASLLVNSGSTVFITMNPPEKPPAELLSLIIEGSPQPPYRVNTPYSLAAIARRLNPQNTYTFTWYVNGSKIGQGQSISHTFSDAGTHILKVEMTSNDPREKSELTSKIQIEFPSDFTVDFTFAPQQKDKTTLQVEDTIIFTENCKDLYNASEYRWYINGDYFKSGASISVRFTAKGTYDVTLAVRKGGNFDEAKRTRTITIADKGIGVLGKERNRFEARGGNSDLSVCSQYWVGGIGDWSSECKMVSRIGPVDGYALCTGPQSDGYNTGFIVFSPKGGQELFFQVYHFNFNRTRGEIHYSGRVPNARNVDPGSISISCRANVADVAWTNEDGSSCQTRIWKFKYSQFISNYGIEKPVCSAPTRDPDKLARCRAFAEKAAEQYRENLSRNCNLTGPEWHGDEERHRQWCLGVTDREADDLNRFRENALCNCGKSWCDAYAARAVAQNEENIKNNCNLTGRRWQSDYSNHYNWCAGTAKAAADSEIRARDKALQNCTGGRENYCGTYAQTAVRQNQRNMDQDCGLCGPRWQSSFDNHFHWCVSHPRQMADAETAIRENILKKCGQSSSKGKKTFYEPCINGYRLDNCLNFDTRCEKPAADRFCKEKGFSEAAAWRLEKARPTYIMDDNRLCDDDFCAGFEYITCQGNQSLTNQSPVCRIKRPESGVTIEPGRYIGFGATASDPDKDKLTYAWTFEGGRPDKWESWQGSVGGVQWNTPGTYTASLTVTDDKGGSCADTVVIHVQNKDSGVDCKGYAEKSVEQNEENLRKNCGFTGELWHSDQDLHIRWCQGADKERCSRNIQLRATALSNCKGPSVTTDLSCDISAPSKIAFINAGESLNFDGTTRGTGKEPLSYHWKFGEYGVIPGTAAIQNPGKVMFKFAGSYTVTFTVTDSAGKTCQSTREVLVHDSNDPREFCEGYAGISMQQNAENKNRNCGFTGEHWHDNELNHQKWCQSVSLEQAKAALAERDEQLRNCGGKTGGSDNKPRSNSFGPDRATRLEGFDNPPDTRPPSDEFEYERVNPPEGFDDLPDTRPPSDAFEHERVNPPEGFDDLPDTRPPSNAFEHERVNPPERFESVPDTRVPSDVFAPPKKIEK